MQWLLLYMLERRDRCSKDFDYACVENEGPHRPDAIRQRDANFQFSKTNKTVNG
jgi:hypothetical protein